MRVCTEPFKWEHYAITDLWRLKPGGEEKPYYLDMNGVAQWEEKAYCTVVCCTEEDTGNVVWSNKDVTKWDGSILIAASVPVNPAALMQGFFVGEAI